jgi:PTH1 family peptidyl-tRNA hydrolase
MKLIVGLGNPGRDYVGTRHNVGFDAIDAIARRCGAIVSPSDFERMAKIKFDALAVDAMVPNGSEKLMLLKPTTFMNLSGRSVQAAMAFYQLTPSDVMIVLDDVALPCGKLRMRSAGSSGGHNGLKDIERALGGSQYPRLRIGVDMPPPRVPQKDYVLGRFSGEQRKLIDPALKRAADAVFTWVDRGIETAMSLFNADGKEAGGGL